MLRILIADDHAIVRRGIRQILTEGFSFPAIEEAADTQALIDLVLAKDWDIVISDLSMPGGGGLEALARIKEARSSLPVLILSIYPEEQYALRVLRMGAAGYLNKDAATEELLGAVKVILSGRRFIQPLIADQLATPLRRQAGLEPHELLSEREFEVFMKLVTGLSITEIAAGLSITSNSVSTYRSRILHKMEMKSNAELISYAVKNDLSG